MGNLEKKAYLRAVRPRYQRANNEDKAVILNEVSATLGWHRKSVIRALSRKIETSGAMPGRSKRVKKVKSPAGRKSKVTSSDVVILGRLLQHCNYVCSKRFVVMMRLWIDHDEQLSGPYEVGQKQRLLSLSAATIDRHLRPFRKACGIKGKSGTKPGSLLREHIPIRSGPWDVTGPGFIEADTVAHCGHSMAGKFAWSLTMTDIFTTWTECRAVWNKGATAVRDAVVDVDKSLPFTIKGFDCDNGSEFLNRVLTKHFTEHPDKPSFTRSRPYKKNDNAHVEQKNWTHVRDLFGYLRIESKEAINAMNDLYKNEVSIINNLFTPSMKLKSKTRVKSQIVKHYDKPMTPCQRLIQVPGFEEQKLHYQNLMLSTNPITLRQQIRAKLQLIYDRLR